MKRETGLESLFDLRSRLRVSLRDCPKPEGDEEEDMASWMRTAQHRMRGGWFYFVFAHAGNFEPQKMFWVVGIPRFVIASTRYISCFARGVYGIVSTELEPKVLC